MIDWVAALTVLWGCQLLVELGNANHHPQKRPIPRQAGLEYWLFIVIYWLLMIHNCCFFVFLLNNVITNPQKVVGVA